MPQEAITAQGDVGAADQDVEEREGPMKKTFEFVCHFNNLRVYHYTSYFFADFEHLWMKAGSH